MKSQDILLMLKLVSLENSESERNKWLLEARVPIPNDWRGWSSEHMPEVQSEVQPDARYSIRGLAQATGISKSETSASLRRCSEVGLVRSDRNTGHARVNTKGLFEFISYGLKYVFPIRVGQMTKGIPTAAFAPVLVGQLLSAGDHSLVWEDPNGSAYGQRVDPIYKSVPHAVRRDAMLYALLALVDSIRIGHERETALSKKVLERYLGRES